jgi:hypothetical protein
VKIGDFNETSRHSTPSRRAPWKFQSLRDFRSRVRPGSRLSQGRIGGGAQKLRQSGDAPDRACPSHQDDECEQIGIGKRSRRRNHPSLSISS